MSQSKIYWSLIFDDNVLWMHSDMFLDFLVFILEGIVAECKLL